MLNRSKRVLSGMRPTGQLHLGHFHGVLKNWLKLQHEFDCFFFVSDWHAYTTHYDAALNTPEFVHNMVVDWLSVGINPGKVCLFVQSRVSEHAELALLLGMITPLTWLERVPTFKDQQLKLKERDLNTYGFLGYPLLMSADILLYKADYVPVGEDQSSHIELTRELARRFNHIYGRDEAFDNKVKAALRQLGKKNAKYYKELQKSYQEQGSVEALETGKALLESAPNLSIGDRERLLGHLEGSGQVILPEPEAQYSEVPKLPGLDGQKMSKSYHNTIGLREDPAQVKDKILKMKTDPARVRRSDPGDPTQCPVWDFHQLYTSATDREWVADGCVNASIGCIDCKKKLLVGLLAEQEHFMARAAPYENNPSLVRRILSDGAEKARETARETMSDVREAMCLNYR